MPTRKEFNAYNRPGQAAKIQAIQAMDHSWPSEFNLEARASAASVTASPQNSVSSEPTKLQM